MIEVHRRLWVGAQSDYDELNDGRPERSWAVVHACKEPFHRQALGYTSRGAPKEHEEYLMAVRAPDTFSQFPCLILNLVDADDPAYVAKEIVDATLAFIDLHRKDRDILLHCNQGRSRSPVLAMLYLAPTLWDEFGQAEATFKACIYPDYDPAKGMREFAKEHWQAYHGRRGAKRGIDEVTV